MNLKKYSKQELIQILESYNTYIIAFGEERWDLDAYPVCLEEFLDNEYQYMLNDRLYKLQRVARLFEGGG